MRHRVVDLIIGNYVGELTRYCALNWNWIYIGLFSSDCHTFPGETYWWHIHTAQMDGVSGKHDSCESRSHVSTTRSASDSGAWRQHWHMSGVSRLCTIWQARLIDIRCTSCTCRNWTVSKTVSRFLSARAPLPTTVRCERSVNICLVLPAICLQFRSVA